MPLGRKLNCPHGILPQNLLRRRFDAVENFFYKGPICYITFDKSIKGLFAISTRFLDFQHRSVYQGILNCSPDCFFYKIGNKVRTYKSSASSNEYILKIILKSLKYLGVKIFKTWVNFVFSERLTIFGQFSNQ